MKSYFPIPSTPESVEVIDELLDAFHRGKQSVSYLEFDGQKASFRQARPHEVLSFGIVYEDSHSGAHRLIMSNQQSISPFVLLFRTKNSGHSFCFMTAEVELSSASASNFAAFFCVQYKELDHPALYTISKWGTDCVCMNCVASQEVVPIHFCHNLFAMIGGMLYGRD